MYKCQIPGSKTTCDRLNLQSKMAIPDLACDESFGYNVYRVCLSSINGSVYLLSLCCGLLFRLIECPISDKYQRKHEPWNDTHENTKNQRIDGESHIYVIDLLLN